MPQMFQCPLVLGSHWRTPILYSAYPAGDSSRIINASPSPTKDTLTSFNGSFDWLRQGCLRDVANPTMGPSVEEIISKFADIQSDANQEGIELPLEMQRFFEPSEELWACVGNAQESGVDLSPLLQVEHIDGPIVRIFDRLSGSYWAYLCLAGKFQNRVFFSECAFDLDFSLEFFESGPLPPVYDTGLSLEQFIHRIWMENYIFYFRMKDYFENAPNELPPDIAAYWKWISHT